MLDAEHRTVDQMRETFALVRQVAHGVDEPVFYQGSVCGTVRKYDAAWMAMYLGRVLGPIRDVEASELFKDAPPEVLKWAVDNLH